MENYGKIWFSCKNGRDFRKKTKGKDEKRTKKGLKFFTLLGYNGDRRCVMKKGKILFCALLAAIFAVIFVGCSSTNGVGEGDYKVSPGYSSKDSFSEGVSGDYTVPESEQENVRAGQMTATAWNDNDFYSMWLEQFVVYDEQSQEQIDVGNK